LAAEFYPARAQARAVHDMLSFLRITLFFIVILLLNSPLAFSCESSSLGSNGWEARVKSCYATVDEAIAACTSCRSSHMSEASSQCVSACNSEGFIPSWPLDTCFVFFDGNALGPPYHWNMFLFDGVGTADTDGDGKPDDQDPCPNNPNPNCTDPHGDADGDGKPDDQDPCPNNPNPDCTDPGGDADGDDKPDDQDPCPYNPNPNCTDPNDPPGPGDPPDIPDEIPVGDCVFDLRSFKEWLNTGSAFPFNLLFRFIGLVTPLFDLTPEPPVFEINWDLASYHDKYLYIPATINFNWNFTPYDTYAKLIRSALILSIIIFVVSYGLNSSKERP
jgi:hypothetical protein